jgi:hypothetical protein
LRSGHNLLKSQQSCSPDLNKAWRRGGEEEEKSRKRQNKTKNQDWGYRACIHAQGDNDSSEVASLKRKFSGATRKCSGLEE